MYKLFSKGLILTQEILSVCVCNGRWWRRCLDMTISFKSPNWTLLNPLAIKIIDERNAAPTSQRKRTLPWEPSPSHPPAKESWISAHRSWSWASVSWSRNPWNRSLDSCPSCHPWQRKSGQQLEPSFWLSLWSSSRFTVGLNPAGGPSVAPHPSNSTSTISHWATHSGSHSDRCLGPATSPSQGIFHHPSKSVCSSSMLYKKLLPYLYVYYTIEVLWISWIMNAAIDPTTKSLLLFFWFPLELELEMKYLQNERRNII